MSLPAANSEAAMRLESEGATANTQKPICHRRREIEANPRARAAKLRAVVRL